MNRNELHDEATCVGRDQTFWRDTYSMKVLVPPAICPAKQRAWKLVWEVRGLSHSVLCGLCCFTAFLFLQASGGRKNCLIMCAQAHRASLAEMPTAWPGAAPHPPPPNPRASYFKDRPHSRSLCDRSQWHSKHFWQRMSGQSLTLMGPFAGILTYSLRADSAPALSIKLTIVPGHKLFQKLVYE